MFNVVKKAKKVIIFLFLTFIILLIACYFSTLFFLPKLFNSQKFVNFIQTKLYEKTNLKLELTDNNYEIQKSLSSVLKIKNIVLKNKNDEKVLSIDNLYIVFNPIKRDKSLIKADNIFFDKTKQLNSNRKKPFSFNFKKLPDIDIKSASLLLNNKNITKINIDNLKGKNQKENYYISFHGDIITVFKDNNIHTTKPVSIILKNDKIIFNDFEISLDNTPIQIKGFYSFNNKYDLDIVSNNLSISFIQKTFLSFMKKKEPDNKNFIENFYDFKGLADINLKVKNNLISGYIDLKEFSAKYVKFSIPLYFKKARFNFNEDKIILNEYGTIGGQKAYTEFSADKIFSDDKLIKGNIKTSANNDFARKYIDNLKIMGLVDLELNYKVYKKEIFVEYIANLDGNSYIQYNNASFEQKNKRRKIYALTHKIKNSMYLEKLNYSTIENNAVKNILEGTGQFDRYNNKYHLNYIAIKTAESTPVNIFGFLNKIIMGGYFEGDVKYKAQDELITGNFSVFNTRYKNFLIKNAKVIADNKIIKVNAEGYFENQPYKAFLDLNNNLKDKITVNNLDLYLKQYILKRNSKKPTKKQIKDRQKIVNKVKEADITIKNAKIRLDKFLFKNIVLENLELEGLVEDNIAYFNMPDIDFAKGKLGAVGIYDLESKSSNIDFSASNIDSSQAADMIFNLKNQFEGFANANLCFKSYNSLDIVDANADFSIENGALVKLGSREFLIKKSKDSSRTFKFKLTDILNVKEKQISSIRSNLNGNFELHNNQIRNGEIFTKQKFVSIYLNGNYNIKSQMADVDIFGKFNKNAQKGIRVFFIPLSWVTKTVFKKSESKDIYIDKLKKIPSISANEKEEEIFVVKLKGNPNNNSSIKVEMKSIR